MKLVWEGDLDIIPHIGWYIRLDGMIGSVPVSSVTLYPDSYGIGIGVNVSVVVEDLYGEFCDEGAGEDE